MSKTREGCGAMHAARAVSLCVVLAAAGAGPAAANGTLAAGGSHTASGGTISLAQPGSFIDEARHDPARHLIGAGAPAEDVVLPETGAAAAQAFRPAARPADGPGRPGTSGTHNGAAAATLSLCVALAYLLRRRERWRHPPGRPHARAGSGD